MRDPRKQLSRILSIPQGELFAHDSIIMNPTTEIQDGQIGHLRPRNAWIRPRKFMEMRIRQHVKRKDHLSLGTGDGGLTLENTTERVMESLSFGGDEEEIRLRSQAAGHDLQEGLRRHGCCEVSFLLPYDKEGILEESGMPSLSYSQGGVAHFLKISCT